MSMSKAAAVPAVVASPVKLVAVTETARAGAAFHLQRIESLTLGAVFFGTPMLGADLGAWASICTGISSILKQTNRDIVGILEPDSSMAESIRLSITNLVATRAHTGNPINIACFYECLTVPGYGSVVVDDLGIFFEEYRSGLARHENSALYRGYNPKFADRLECQIL